MKQEIIEQMRSHLSGTRYCKSDFEKYDVPQLEEINEPFFWMVREYGTEFVFVGPSSIKKFYSNQVWRMGLFRNKFDLISSFLYYDNDKNAKFFFWNGCVLLQISIDQLKEAYCNIIDQSYKELCRDFKTEFEVCREPLEVRFSCKEAEKSWGESVKYAESLCDNSLTECLEKLKRHRRDAIDQYILISRDYSEHCFSFGEFINGKCQLNGGIILHDYLTENRWSTHT